ncbi:hypothetical protein ACF0H5_005236 [Mactra antiquata]
MTHNCVSVHEYLEYLKTAANEDRFWYIKEGKTVRPSLSNSNTQTGNMANFRYKAASGSDRYVQVCEWKGELRVDLREWNGDKPTKNGISLTLMRWMNFVNAIEYVGKTVEQKLSYGNHLGGNVLCNVAKNSVYVDIRQYWKPQEEVVPTKKGLCLRPSEYSRLKQWISEIGRALPELDGVVPCYLQGDHMNQLGALQCSECNPDDFTKW